MTLAKQGIYRWRGITLQGKIITGEMSAIDKQQARQRLHDQGVTHVTLHKKFFPTAFKNHISQRELAIFFQQLATLLSTGIPIMNAFDILQTSHANLYFSQIIIKLQQELQMGHALSRSLAKFPHYFAPFFCHLVHAGEQSGTLPTMLTRIAHHIERAYQFRKKILQALLYPTLVLGIACIVTCLMLIIVIPRFADLFHELHGSLPMLTQWVIYCSWLLRHYGLGMILGICLIFYFIRKQYPSFRHSLQLILLKMPHFKLIMIKMLLIPFARNLATLLIAGIPIAEALNMLAELSQHTIYTQQIAQLQFDIANGQTLYHALQRNKLFPILMVQMIRIGEESGSLSDMLEKIASIYEADNLYFIDNVSQLLEPLIMVILGVLIGGLVIALYLPIFKQGTLV